MGNESTNTNITQSIKGNIVLVDIVDKPIMVVCTNYKDGVMTYYLAEFNQDLVVDDVLLLWDSIDSIDKLKPFLYRNFFKTKIHLKFSIGSLTKNNTMIVSALKNNGVLEIE